MTLVTIRVCRVCGRIVRTVFGQDVCACKGGPT